MDNLQEELAGFGIEYENGTVDGFCRKVTFLSLVDRDSVDICVIDKPNNLI